MPQTTTVISGSALQAADDIQLVFADDRTVVTPSLLRMRPQLTSAGRGHSVAARIRGQRNFPGWWWSATTRSHVVYESWLGRHHLIEADHDDRVTGIAGRPFELT
jgi:hypothetical protein